MPKPIPEEHRRSINVSVRFKPEEHEALVKRAERTMRGASSFVRDSALRTLDMPLPQTKRTPSGFDRQLAKLVGSVRTISADMRRLVDGEANPLDPAQKMGDLAKEVAALRRETMNLIAAVQAPRTEPAQPASE